MVLLLAGYAAVDWNTAEDDRRLKQLFLAIVCSCILGGCSGHDSQGNSSSLLLGRAESVVRADAAAGSGFTLLSSVRELPDGTILAADLRENRLVLIDPVMQRVEELSRAGDGPGEFRRAGWLYDYGRDSTVITDAVTRRWHVFNGSSPTRTLVETGQIQQWFGPLLHGVSATGRILGTRQHPALRGNPRQFADTLVLMLARMESEIIDTVALLAGPGRYRESELPRRGRSMRVAHPLRSEDQAILFEDGFIAIVHIDPYHVEWISPDGEVTKGASLPVAPTRLTDEEKCFAVQRITVGDEGCEVADSFEWPLALPPFMLYDLGSHVGLGTRTVFADPYGRVLIRRTESARHREQTRYDLVDRNGQLVATLALPSNEVVVGFGRKSIYLVSVNDDELQSLRRHPWHP